MWGKWCRRLGVSSAGGGSGRLKVGKEDVDGARLSMILLTSSPERRKSSAAMLEVGKVGDAEVWKCDCGEEKLVGAGVLSEMGKNVAVDVFSAAAEVAKLEGAEVEGAELVCAGKNVAVAAEVAKLEGAEVEGAGLVCAGVGK